MRESKKKYMKLQGVRFPSCAWAEDSRQRPLWPVTDFSWLLLPCVCAKGTLMPSPLAAGLGHGAICACGGSPRGQAPELMDFSGAITGEVRECDGAGNKGWRLGAQRGRP